MFTVDDDVAVQQRSGELPKGLGNAHTSSEIAWVGILENVVENLSGKNGDRGRLGHQLR